MMLASRKGVGSDLMSPFRDVDDNDVNNIDESNKIIPGKPQSKLMIRLKTNTANIQDAVFLTIYDSPFFGSQEI